MQLSERDISIVQARASGFVERVYPLAPGDVIVSGTPGGVGDKRNPPLYMQAGDTVEVEIGVIGTLVNTITE